MVNPRQVTPPVPDRDEGMTVPAPVVPMPTPGQTTDSGIELRVDPGRLVRTRIRGKDLFGSSLVNIYEERSVGDLVADFDRTWGTPEGDALVQLLKASGYTSAGSKNKSTIRNDYLDAIAEAQRNNETLVDVLSRAPLANALELTGKSGAGPYRSETTTFVEYDSTNVSDIANAAYRARLGRAATKKEREALADILNQEQQKNPQVTISQGATSGGAVVGADGQRTARGTVGTTTTSGGIDVSEIAQQAALEDEDYEEVFNRVVSFDLMKRVLDRPV